MSEDNAIIGIPSIIPKFPTNPSREALSIRRWPLKRDLVASNISRARTPGPPRRLSVISPSASSAITEPSTECGLNPS